jgi:hypothetical protein
MEHTCGFDRSELYCEGPPIGAVAAAAWAEAASENVAWVLQSS